SLRFPPIFRRERLPETSSVDDKVCMPSFSTFVQCHLLLRFSGCNHLSDPLNNRINDCCEIKKVETWSLHFARDGRDAVLIANGPHLERFFRADEDMRQRC